MSYQLSTAKIWDGSAWVNATGGGTSGPWWSQLKSTHVYNPINAVQVSASSTIHTKGAWTEIVASTSGDSDLLSFFANFGSGGALATGLLDIGVGAAGSEVVVVENMAIGQQRDYVNFIPVAIPAGSRLAVRVQSGIASRTAGFYFTLTNTGAYSSTDTTVDVMGSDTATSEGVALTNNTWVEVASSTANAYQAIVIVPSASNASMSNQLPVYELGIGLSGAEVSVGSIGLTFTSNEIVSYVTTNLGLVGGPFPAGSRLSVRTSAGGGGTADVCLLGIK